MTWWPGAKKVTRLTGCNADKYCRPNGINCLCTHYLLTCSSITLPLFDKTNRWSWRTIQGMSIYSDMHYSNVYWMFIDTLRTLIKNVTFYRAMHFSAKRGIAIVCCPSVCPSVRLSVTFRYRDHIGWNSSKITSRPNSLRPSPGLTPKWAIWCNGNTPKTGAE